MVPDTFAGLLESFEAPCVCVYTCPMCPFSLQAWKGCLHAILHIWRVSRGLLMWLQSFSSGFITHPSPVPISTKKQGDTGKLFAGDLTVLRIC